MSTAPPPPSHGSEPAWEVAHLYPPQGEWSEEDYFLLTAGRNHLVEFTDGRIDVLAMPTTSHQLMVLFLVDLLRAFARPKQLGEVLLAPLSVRIRPNVYREPDVVFMLAEHRKRAGEEFWDGADLVMEVVSKDAESRKRDYQAKPKDYAAAGISEYWIVDPIEARITVLRLDSGSYSVHGEFTVGQQASSVLLDGFVVDVAQVFAAGRGGQPSSGARGDAEERPSADTRR